MATKVDLCNMALSRLGHSNAIENITDDEAGAIQCNLHYDVMLDEAFKTSISGWQFANQRAVLVTEAGTPPEPWSFQYTYPATPGPVCIYPIMMDDGAFVRLPKNRIPFTEGRATSGARVIFVNESPACLFFVERITDVSKYPSHFIAMFVSMLTSRIAMGVTNNKSLYEDVRAEESLYVQQALAVEFNSEQSSERPESERMTIRE